jgi:hypothetical protein
MTIGLAVLHAALPNHWLPFVLVGRSLKWTKRRTLSVLALAGSGHVLTTSALGLLVWWLGESTLAKLHLEDWGAKIAGGLLVGLGLIFLILHALGRHGHTHARGEVIYVEEHEHPEGFDDHAQHDHAHSPAKLGERGAVATLFLALTLSPCEVVVAAFLAGLKFGLSYVLLLALGASVATVAAMFVLTWLTLHGVERLRLPWLDRHEMSITGVILSAIGLLFLLYEG